MMKFLSLLADFTALSLIAIGVASGQTLPALPNDLCDYDTIYDSIRTGNVVEVTLSVRYRNCPANRDNKPCRAPNSDGFAPGALLNGVQSDNAITVNDDIPGPEIRAKLGDTVRVNIVNYLGEPTTMHFHGITQFRTPFADGDPGVTNCAIGEGQSHVYEFVAHPAGTTFYHSHAGTQRMAGMTGPLVIEDDEEPYADVPDKHVFIQDWFNQNSDTNYQFWAQNTAPDCVTFGGNFFAGKMNGMNKANGAGPVTGDGYLFQSFIVNGEGVYQYEDTQVNDGLSQDPRQCPGQYTSAPRCEYCLDPATWTAELCTLSSADNVCGQPAVIEVDAGVETRLRFAHAGGLLAAQVCIDGHGIDIIAADGSPVEPYSTDCFIIMPAERIDAIIKPESPGDFLIRLTTLEQNPVSANANVKEHYEGFPHVGYTILRVKDPASLAGPQYLAGFSPIACDDSTTVNCGPDYWLTSKTVGCAAGPSSLDPERCVTNFAALKAATSPSPNSDESLCANANKKMAHEVDPNVKATVKVNYMPDEVPRWENMGHATRLEILMEDDVGFPYITPGDPAEWISAEPIAFVNPSSPTLSLSPDQRAELYAKRTVGRASDEENAGELFPNYPENFSSVVTGPNALVTTYGDVVRIYFSCVEPFGPGCAMQHPMHLHGNKMAVLYSGEWDEEYNESKFDTNPLYRDTVTINTDTYTVVQVAATNPGAWRLHCHVNIHNKGGMAMLLDVGGDSDVEAARATPDSANLCPIQPNNKSTPPVDGVPADDLTDATDKESPSVVPDSGASEKESPSGAPDSDVTDEESSSVATEAVAYSLLVSLASSIFVVFALA